MIRMQVREQHVSNLSIRNLRLSKSQEHVSTDVNEQFLFASLYEDAWPDSLRKRRWPARPKQRHSEVSRGLSRCSYANERYSKRHYRDCQAPLDASSKHTAPRCAE
jgi:hypothetical protein